MSSVKLSQVGELSLLEQIRRKFGRRSKGVLVGIGDDAAVLKSEDEYLLATTDMMVEGVHFDLRFITAYQLGFKLISVNVSDIYAMGGKPSYILLNVAVSRNTTKEFIDSFFEGIKDAMSLFHASLIGGDISSADKGMSVSATVIGHADKYIRRSGASAGDKIYVTGSLGDSACGLQLLKKIKKPVPLQFRCSKLNAGRSVSARCAFGGGKKREGLNPVFQGSRLRSRLPWKIIEPLLRRHVLPEARASKKISVTATSMIDISDGLLIDLSRLCDESGVGARIYEKNIPMSLELKKAASHLGLNALELALSGGEDYELLFTAGAGKNVKAIYIGDVIRSGRWIVDQSGRERAFSADGYRHFGRRDIDE